jgi:aryl-alcohol dehydrogenase-like predicted oxidoreductase
MGVTWYDVAPPYGDGAAESLLGGFLEFRRDRVVVCTKVGISRPVVSPLGQIVRPAARVAVRMFPQLRAGIARMRGAAPRVPIRPEYIEASVVESLRQLRTDYIDVLALHEPTPSACSDSSMLRTLERIVEKGYVRSISIAGPLEAIAAGAQASPVYRFGQFENSVFTDAASRLRTISPQAAALTFVTHGLFGMGTLEKFKSNFDSGAWKKSELLANYVNLDQELSADQILLDHAFAENPNGIVLSSMFATAHIDRNCRRASLAPNQECSKIIDALFLDNSTERLQSFKR